MIRNTSSSRSDTGSLFPPIVHGTPHSPAREFETPETASPLTVLIVRTSSDQIHTELRLVSFLTANEKFRAYYLSHGHYRRCRFESVHFVVASVQRHSSRS